MVDKAKASQKQVNTAVKKIIEKGKQCGAEISYGYTDNGRLMVSSKVDGNVKRYPLNPHVPVTEALKSLGLVKLKS
jgi:hypothetical protein